MPELFYLYRQEKLLHYTAVVRTTREVYGSFKHAETVLPQLYF